jgi:DNA-binding transcriptional regulator of glucitol operon
MSVLLVVIAIGMQSLQAWLEHRDYDRHFDD